MAGSRARARRLAPAVGREWFADCTRTPVADDSKMLIMSANEVKAAFGKFKVDYFAVAE